MRLWKWTKTYIRNLTGHSRLLSSKEVVREGKYVKIYTPLQNHWRKQPSQGTVVSHSLKHCFLRAFVPRCPLFRLKKPKRQREAVRKKQVHNYETETIHENAWSPTRGTPLRRSGGTDAQVQSQQRGFTALLLSDLHGRPRYSSTHPFLPNRELVQYVPNLIKINVSALLSLHKIFKRLQLKAIRERSICVFTMCATFSYLFEKIKIKQLLLFIPLTLPLQILSELILLLQTSKQGRSITATYCQNVLV